MSTVGIWSPPGSMNMKREGDGETAKAHDIPCEPRLFLAMDPSENGYPRVGDHHRSMGDDHHDGRYLARDGRNYELQGEIRWGGLTNNFKKVLVTSLTCKSASGARDPPSSRR